METVSSITERNPLLGEPPECLGSRVSLLLVGAEPSKLFLHELIQVCASFPLAWTAGKPLHVQEDTLFRKVRGVGRPAGRAPLWAESLDLEQDPEGTFWDS